MDKLSVIIRCRNEESYIGFAIQSVIDHFDNIKTIQVNEYSPGYALNQGIKLCSNDIVLILSSHSQITKVDFEKVKKDLEVNVAVFGNQTPIYKGKKITKRYIWSHFHNKLESNMYSDIEDRYFLHNAFL